MAPPHLETARLVLGWPDDAQLDDYRDAIVGTPMFDTILWEGPRSPTDLREHWAARRAQGDDPKAPFSVALVEKATGRMVGAAALRPVEGDATILDLGYALAPHAHGRGLATEAVTVLVEEGFAHRSAERVFACVFVGNAASRRVAEKAGLVLEGIARHSIGKRGRRLDEWVLATTRPDWLSRRVSVETERLATDRASAVGRLRALHEELARCLLGVSYTESLVPAVRAGLERTGLDVGGLDLGRVAAALSDAEECQREIGTWSTGAGEGLSSMAELRGLELARAFVLRDLDPGAAAALLAGVDGDPNDVARSLAVHRDALRRALAR